MPLLLQNLKTQTAVTMEPKRSEDGGKDLGFEQKEPTLCFEDNKAAIMTAENECSAAGRM